MTSRQASRPVRGSDFPEGCAPRREVAFLAAGGTTIALFAWAKAAREAAVAEQPRPAAFRGVTLAWNCQDCAEVDTVLAFALGHGAKLPKPAAPNDYGGAGVS